MKRVLSPNAFIAPFMKPVDSSDSALKEKFQEQYREEIQELWNKFLEDVAVEKVAEQYPGLKTPLKDTPLSVRAKNCLRAAGVETVADISRFSPAELKLIRGAGAGTINEIKDYMSSVLSR